MEVADKFWDCNPGSFRDTSSWWQLELQSCPLQAEGVLVIGCSLAVHVILPVEWRRAELSSVTFGCLRAHTDFAVASWVSARIIGKWCRHPLRHKWWGRAIFEGKMMNFIDSVYCEVSVSHPSRDDQDWNMGLRCLEGTYRWRHCDWAGDKVKSCPGSICKLYLWEHLRVGREIQIQKLPESRGFQVYLHI